MKNLLFFISLCTLLTACSGGQSDSAGEETATETETTTPAQTAPAAESQAEPQMAANLRNALRNDLLKNDLANIPEDSRRFSYAEADLNGDGKDEYLVGFRNPYFCGSGGCTFYLLDHEGARVTRFTVADAPFIVLPSKTNGWNDLVVYSNGALRKLTFNGTRYPSNPSTAPEYGETPGDGLPRLIDYDKSIPEYSF